MPTVQAPNVPWQPMSSLQTLAFRKGKRRTESFLEKAQKQRNCERSYFLPYITIVAVLAFFVELEIGGYV